ncbi:TIM barrel protein [bacterium]|nr:TIM barrel protein [bacterium]
MGDISRRDISRSLLALAGIAPLSSCATAQPAPFFRSRQLPIGIQLYTLAPDLRENLDGVLQRVAEIGYETVEIPGYMGRTPQELRRALDAVGLACPSAHVGLRPGSEAEPGLLGDLDRLAEHMKVLGVEYVVAPSISPPVDLNITAAPGEGYGFMGRVAAAMSEDHWKRIADMLNQAAIGLGGHGLKVGYHNHNFEFTPVLGQPPGGTTGLDVLLRATDPALVVFELDVGWAAAAGADPVAVLRSSPGRFRLMHVKDILASTRPNFALKMDPTEVGSGRVDWPTLIPEANRLGVTGFFVEQEPPFTMARIESAAKSYAYLAQIMA